MGLPFGSGGWCDNPIIKLAGNPTIFCVLFMGGRLAHQVWGLKSAFRGVKLAARHISRFLAHRPVARRTVLAGVELPGTWVARGQACSRWCAGAVGGFRFLHTSIFFYHPDNR